MSSQNPTCDTVGRTAPQCSDPEPKTLGVFLKVAAAVLGIACHFGSVNAQVQLPGATAPGVPTTPYARPDDSTTGVTQATPANRAMTCQTGHVVSGGQCVALATLIPSTPDCAYGQVRSGGTCVALPTQTTPPTNCPTGQVLSGGVCVPLNNNPTPTCAAQPDTTQYIPCPSGQTGSIVQSRNGTCNASTSYTWSMTGWSTTSNSCSVAPVQPSCPAQPATSQSTSCPSGQTGVVYQARSATCNASTGFTWSMGNWYTSSNSCQTTTVACPEAPPATQSLACPAGQTGSITQSRSMTCNTSIGTWTLGAWYQSGSSCTTPPPAACDGINVVDLTWGAGCIYNGYTPQTAVGASVTIRNQNPSFESASYQTYRCSSAPAGWSLVSQNCLAKPPIATTGCASQIKSWWGQHGGACGGTVPSLGNGQMFKITLENGNGLFQCLDGNLNTVSTYCQPDPQGG